ncbi:MAG: hypothetical protein CR974_04130 [Gammaproteobacteria bacterium]|nr:MAG: hypothetical protein CR974_04130 [Gammaproteobacteria bacterium]
MSKFTQSLRQFYGEQQKAVAIIDAVQANGYACRTVTDNRPILLTGGDYSAGDNVYYDVRTRAIISKAPAVSWSDVPV